MSHTHTHTHNGTSVDVCYCSFPSFYFSLGRLFFLACFSSPVFYLPHLSLSLSLSLSHSHTHTHTDCPFRPFRSSIVSCCDECERLYLMQAHAKSVHASVAHRLQTACKAPHPHTHILTHTHTLRVSACKRRATIAAIYNGTVKVSAA